MKKKWRNATTIVVLLFAIFFGFPESSRGQQPITLASNLHNPFALTVDQSNVYWIETFFSANGTTFVIRKMPLNGGTSIDIATQSFGFIGANAPSIDVDNTWVYWSINPGSGSGFLYKVPITGGTPTILAGANQPTTIKIDNSFVYWVETNSGTLGTMGVRRVPIAGGLVETLTVGGLQYTGLTLDAQFAYYSYIACFLGCSATQPRLARVPKSGGVAEDLAVLLETASDIVVTSGSVYWVESETGTLQKVSKNGGAVTPLASGLSQPMRIAVDATNVYWTEFAGGAAGAGAVKSIPASGGAVAALASGLNGPFAIDADGVAIYWTELGTNGTDGAIKKIGFAITPPMTLAEKAAALAKTLKGAPYGYGGKGYDFQLNRYVDANAIFGGYTYNLFDCNTTALIGLVKAKGVDCSGLVMWSYNTASGATTKFDKDNPIQYPTANGQYLHDATITVSKDDLKPGDLLFFNYQHEVGKKADHVAMYVGGDDVLEAYTCLSQYPSGNYVIPSSKLTRDTTDPITGQRLDPCTPSSQVACFVGFRRVPIPVTTSSVKLRTATHSPVTLAVTDPDGFSITAATLSFTDREVLREVADVLYYIEDTNSDDTIISPVLKTGAYLIKVFPKPGTNSTDTYSVVVDAAGSTLTLADKVPIRNIPSQGYGIRSTGAAISQFIPVAIDIKPGSSDNPINPKSNGKIPVAILSSTTFNAPREVDVASLSFGRTGNERSLAFCNTGGEDVNADGLVDLVCHFDTQAAAFRSGDTQGILNGKTVNTIPITGKDSVRIVP